MIITQAHKSITSAVVTPVNRQDNEPTRLRDSGGVAVTTLSVSQLGLGCTPCTLKTDADAPCMRVRLTLHFH